MAAGEARSVWRRPEGAEYLNFGEGTTCARIGKNLKEIIQISFSKLAASAEAVRTRSLFQRNRSQIQ